MKYAEFLQKLKEDQELAKKYQEKLEANQVEGKEPWKVAADAAKELGFDLDETEVAVEERGARELSLEELEMVTGGSRETCFFDYTCSLAYNTCNVSSECSASMKCEGTIR